MGRCTEGRVQEAVTTRIRAGWKRFKDVATVLCKKGLSINLRGLLYKMDIRSAVIDAVIRQFLAEINIASLEHPPYSPGLAPCDFFLIPKIKSVLKETRFSDIDFIKIAATTELKKMSENAFQECFESWKRRMYKCFQVEGDYFEGI